MTLVAATVAENSALVELSAVTVCGYTQWEQIL